MNIRPLSGADAAQFQALRLRALRDNPEAFGSTHEEESATPLATIAARLTDGEAAGTSFVLGAFHGSTDARLIGMAACFRQSAAKERHRAMVGGMYVAPEARGQGIGAQLLEAVIRRASAWDGLEQLVLTVVPANAAARALYIRHGFRSVGRAPQALKHEGRYYDVEYFWLPLGAADNSSG